MAQIGKGIRRKRTEKREGTNKEQGKNEETLKKSKGMRERRIWKLMKSEENESLFTLGRE